MSALLIAAVVLQARLSPSTAQVRHAFDADRLAAARRLLAANGSDATREQRIGDAARTVLIAPVADCLNRARSDKPAKQDCDNLSAEAQRDLDRVPAMLPALAAQMRDIEERAYAERFTADELDAITRFAASPTGKKLAMQGDTVALEVGLGVKDLLLYDLRHPLPGKPAR